MKRDYIVAWKIIGRGGISIHSIFFSGPIEIYKEFCPESKSFIVG